MPWKRTDLGKESKLGIGYTWFKYFWTHNKLSNVAKNWKLKDSSFVFYINFKIFQIADWARTSATQRLLHGNGRKIWNAAISLIFKQFWSSLDLWVRFLDLVHHILRNLENYQKLNMLLDRKFNISFMNMGSSGNKYLQVENSALHHSAILD